MEERRESLISLFITVLLARLKPLIIVCLLFVQALTFLPGHQVFLGAKNEAIEFEG